MDRLHADSFHALYEKNGSKSAPADPVRDVTPAILYTHRAQLLGKIGVAKVPTL